MLLHHLSILVIIIERQTSVQVVTISVTGKVNSIWCLTSNQQTISVKEQQETYRAAAMANTQQLEQATQQTAGAML